MPGAPDPEYVLARRVLLDALQALGEQRSAVVLVALDILRLLQAVPLEIMADGVSTLLGKEISAEVTEEALSFLRNLFSEPSRPGCQMAARAAAPLEPEDTIAASCAFLTQDLLRAIGSR